MRGLTLDSTLLQANRESHESQCLLALAYSASIPVKENQFLHLRHAPQIWQADFEEKLHVVYK